MITIFFWEEGGNFEGGSLLPLKYPRENLNLLAVSWAFALTFKKAGSLNKFSCEPQYNYFKTRSNSTTNNKLGVRPKGNHDGVKLKKDAQAIQCPCEIVWAQIKLPLKMKES